METQPCTLMYTIPSSVCNMLAAQPLMSCGFGPAVHLKGTTSSRGNGEHMTAVKCSSKCIHCMLSTCCFASPQKALNAAADLHAQPECCAALSVQSCPGPVS